MVKINNSLIIEEDISRDLNVNDDSLVIQPLDLSGVGGITDNLQQEADENDLEDDLPNQPPVVVPPTQPPADTQAPVSTVDVLPNNVPEDFAVTWYGFDNGGSGIASYDVFVSTNGGEYVLWQENTTALSGIYDGQGDRTYQFYSVATDNAGNVESNDRAQASTNTGNSTQQPAIYRLFNSSTGVHLYTSAVPERDSVIQNLPNYSYEGVAYFAANPESGVPVYRLYSPTVDGHFYTVSEAERDEVLATTDYRLEANNGQAFTAFAEQVEGTIPVYRFFLPDTGAYFYTSDENERESIIQNLPNYTFQGVAYYSFPLNADFTPLPPPEPEVDPSTLSFLGSEISLQIYSPDFETPVTNGLTTVVGDGVEFGDLPADDIEGGGTPIDVNVDVTPTSVLFEVEQPTGGTFNDGEFNGYVFFDLNDTVPLIQNVTLDPAGTTLAVDDSDVIFIDDAFALDVGGVNYNPGDTVKLDFTFGAGSSTPDPEPEPDPEPTPNGAGFNGAELTYQEYSPDLETPFGDPFEITIGEGVELNIADGQLSENGIGTTIDIDNDTIRYEIVTSNPGSTFSPADFNGFVLFDLTDTLPTVTNVTIDQTATTLGIDESDIVFIEDAIAVNVENVPFVNGDVIQLDVDFAADSTGGDTEPDPPVNNSGSNFIGAELEYQTYSPNIDTPVGEPLTAVVGDGVEFNLGVGDDTLTGGFVDITENSIVYEVDSTQFSSFLEAEFNGFTILDLTDNLPAIENVTIDESNTTIGIDASRLVFTEDGVAVNVQGLTFNDGDTIKLDVDFADV